MNERSLHITYREGRGRDHVPDVVTLDRLNSVLASLGRAPLAAQEFRPLTAA